MCATVCEPCQGRGGRECSRIAVSSAPEQHEQMDLDEVRIAVVGLGYVGLPLAVEFGRQFPTVGLDIKADRIAEFKGWRRLDLGGRS